MHVKRRMNDERSMMLACWNSVSDDESYVDTLVAERRRPITVVDGDKVPLNEGCLLYTSDAADE